MLIKPTKDYRWQIDGKAIAFKAGEEQECSEPHASEMIEAGYAEKSSGSKPSIVENKAIESTQKTKKEEDDKKEEKSGDKEDSDSKGDKEVQEKAEKKTSKKGRTKTKKS